MYFPLKTVRLNDLQIGYRVYGEGPDILFIHGWGSSSRMWQTMMTALSPRYRCWAIDLPGFGDSDKPIHEWYSIPNYAQSVKEFMERLGLSQPCLIGHSMGGMIALNLTAEDPAVAVRQFLINPVVTGRIYLDLRLLAHSPLSLPMLKIGYWVWPLVTSDWLHWNRPLFNKKQAAHVNRVREDWGKATSVSAVGAVKAIGQCDLTSRLSQINIPTLIVVGNRDLTAPNREGRLAARHVRGARLVVLPTGHLPTDEVPEKIQSLADDFLSN